MAVGTADAVAEGGKHVPLKWAGTIVIGRCELGRHGVSRTLNWLDTMKPSRLEPVPGNVEGGQQGTTSRYSDHGSCKVVVWIQ